jgi:hypothetical protein
MFQAIRQKSLVHWAIFLAIGISAGGCEVTRYASVEVTSTPPDVLLTVMPTGEIFMRTPDHKVVPTTMCCFAKEPHPMHLVLLAERDGYKTMVKSIDITHWNKDAQAAVLDTMKFNVNLPPCGGH